MVEDGKKPSLKEIVLEFCREIDPQIDDQVAELRASVLVEFLQEKGEELATLDEINSLVERTKEAENQLH